jgi:hypothetical protein
MSLPVQTRRLHTPHSSITSALHLLCPLTPVREGGGRLLHTDSLNFNKCGIVYQAKSPTGRDRVDQ